MHSPSPPSDRTGWRPAAHLGTGDSPVVKLLDLIVSDALHGRYRQVHLRGDSVRFERDGAWSEYMPLPSVVTQRLINRVRFLATLGRIKGNARQEGAINASIQGAPFQALAAVQFDNDGHEEVLLSLPDSPIPAA